MSHRVLINGFGRIGKLATRLAWYDHKKDFSSETPTGIWGQELEIVGINDPKGNIQVAQHLLEFDSTHGRFPIKIYEDGKHLFLGNKKVKYSNFNNLEEAITFHDNIDIILEEINDAILIPEQAILTAKDYSYVFVVDKDTAKLQKITMGVNNDGNTQILSGINSGDMVVTLGHEKLKDGSKIQIIQE